MRDGTGALWCAVNSQRPVVVVFYPDLVVRNHLLELVTLLASPERSVERTSRVDDVFDTNRCATLLLLTPDDEERAVIELDGRREALIAREAPAVLFLLRGGCGAEALQQAAGIESWTRGLEVDPEALEQIDVDKERAQFEHETGRSPEAWLAGWHGDEIPDTLENNLRLHDAMLLEHRK